VRVGVPAEDREGREGPLDRLVAEVAVPGDTVPADVLEEDRDVLRAGLGPTQVVRDDPIRLRYLG
jgi:hypothetical protein